MREIEPVPRLLTAHEVDPASLSALQRLARDRLVAAKERALLDLMGVTVTVDGPETPDTRQVAEELRAMIAEVVPEPVPLVVGPRGNRRQRRAAAARQRRTA